MKIRLNHQSTDDRGAEMVRFFHSEGCEALISAGREMQKDKIQMLADCISVCMEYDRANVCVDERRWRFSTGWDGRRRVGNCGYSRFERRCMNLMDVVAVKIKKIMTVMVSWGGKWFVYIVIIG
jgi:hypothetical protein